jgi:hypothetical protein
MALQLALKKAHQKVPSSDHSSGLLRDLMKELPLELEVQDLWVLLSDRESDLMKVRLWGCRTDSQKVLQTVPRMVLRMVYSLVSCSDLASRR